MSSSTTLTLSFGKKILIDLHKIALCASQMAYFNCSRFLIVSGIADKLKQPFTCSSFSLHNAPISSGNFSTLKQSDMSRKLKFSSFPIDPCNPRKLVHELSLNTSRFKRLPIFSGRWVRLWQFVTLSFFRVVISQISSGKFCKWLQYEMSSSVKFGNALATVTGSSPMLQKKNDAFSRLFKWLQERVIEGALIRSSLILLRLGRESRIGKLLISALEKELLLIIKLFRFVIFSMKGGKVYLSVWKIKMRTSTVGRSSSGQRVENSSSVGSPMNKLLSERILKEGEN